MIEPAALTLPASAGPLLFPPVTDVFRDDELDVLETKITGAEIALRNARYDDVVAILDELTIFRPSIRTSRFGRCSPTRGRGCVAASSTTRSQG